MSEEKKSNPEAQHSQERTVDKTVLIKNEEDSAKISGKDFSFRKYAWKQFKKNKPAYFSLYILAFLLVLALLAPILANERPLYMKYQGQTFFPAFSFDNNDQIKNSKTGI